MESSEPPQGEITELLGRIKRGVSGAEDDFFELVYERISEIAGRIAGRRGTPTTLSLSDVCQEAATKFLGNGALKKIEDREHFYAAFSLAVKQVLIDYSRRKNTLSRGAGELRRLELDMVLGHFCEHRIDFLEFNDALDLLWARDPRAARVIEMRFFGGFKVNEVAQALGIGKSTVENDTALAKAFLMQQLDPFQGNA